MPVELAEVCRCAVCGHRWIAEGVPLRCAKCKTRRWNSEPIKDKRSELGDDWTNGE